MRLYTVAFTAFCSGLVLFLLSARFSFAWAATYYVAPTGNDTNVGTTLTSPFKTFAKAVGVLQPGDTLKVAGATYAENLLMNKSGTAASHITIQPVDNLRPVVDLQKSNTDGQWPIAVTGSYVDIEGFEARGSSGTCASFTGQYITSKNFVVHDCVGHGTYTDGQHIVIDGHTIYDTNLENAARTWSSGWGSALKIRVGADDVLLTNNTIYHNYGEGIAVTRGKNVIVRGNTVYDNYAVNIYIDNSINTTVERNFSYCTGNATYNYLNGNRPSAIAMGEEYYDGWGAQLSNVRVVNNVTAFCQRNIFYFGSDVNGGLDGALIANNTLWGSIQSAISIAYDPVKTRNIEIANNIIQQNNSLSWIENASAVTIHNNLWFPGLPSDPGSKGTNDIAADPKIVGNPSALDPLVFRLSANSPAKDTGQTIAGITNDFEGNARTGAFDIGAFEYGGTLLVTPQPSPTATVGTPTPVVARSCDSADINQDGIVDLQDYSILVGDFFKSTPSNPRSDINHDGLVDLSDYSVLVGHFFNRQTCP